MNKNQILQNALRKISDSKRKREEEESTGELNGMIAQYVESEFNLNAQLRDDLVGAIRAISISVPDINVKVPEMPAITIPEIRVPEVNVPAPQVTVNVPEIKLPVIKVPKADVTVNIPEIRHNTLLPDYDSGTVAYKLEPPTEEWTLCKDGKEVCILSIVYRDTDMNTVSGFTIKKL